MEIQLHGHCIRMTRTTRETWPLDLMCMETFQFELRFVGSYFRLFEPCCALVLFQFLAVLRVTVPFRWLALGWSQIMPSMLTKQWKKGKTNMENLERKLMWFTPGKNHIIVLSLIGAQICGVGNHLMHFKRLQLSASGCYLRGNPAFGRWQTMFAMFRVLEWHEKCNFSYFVACRALTLILHTLMFSQYMYFFPEICRVCLIAKTARNKFLIHGNFLIMMADGVFRGQLEPRGLLSLRHTNCFGSRCRAALSLAVRLSSKSRIGKPKNLTIRSNA